MRRLRPALGALLASSLVVLGLGAAPAHAADGTITGVALDASGKPLKNVGWEIYVLEGGEWTTLPFGPKLTNDQGRFSWKVPVGGKYRVCFQDSYYGEMDTASGFWQPEVRHRDTCWPSSATFSGATTWTPTAQAPSKTFTVKLPRQGLGMAPVEPFVSGSYQVGEPLTVLGQEGWRPTNATFTYQWMSHTTGSSPTPIAGATGKTFTPTNAQSGRWVWVQVTASRAGYKPATLTSPVTKVGTVHVEPTSPLKITGTAAAGSTLTASFGRPANTYSQLTWFVDGVPQPNPPAPNATSSRFTVTAAHAGARVEARLKMYRTDAQTGNYVDGSDTYRRVQVQVAGTRPVRTLAAAPAPAGRATVGATLSAPRATADASATVTYQWLRGSSAIPRATSSRYRVQAADAGKNVAVRVTVTRPGWWNRYVTTSRATAARGVIKTGSVKISGTTKVGRKLKARATSWGPRPVKVRYQWLRNNRVVRGATKSTYKVRKADRGKTLKVRVTVSKPGYTTVAKNSKGRKIKR